MGENPLGIIGLGELLTAANPTRWASSWPDATPAQLEVQLSDGTEIIHVAPDGTITILPDCTVEQWLIQATNVFHAARQAQGGPA